MAKPRNWHAVNAHMRNSSGPIKDEKKENNKNECRNFNKDLEELEFVLMGFNKESERLDKQININPTRDHIKQIMKNCDDYSLAFSITPAQIEELFNIKVSSELNWFFETL